MSCPDENELNAFVARVLPEPAAVRVEEHLDDCGRCFSLLAEIARALAPVETAEDGASDDEEVTAYGGRYVPERILGVGGQGLVYAAIDRVLDRSVALKVLLHDDPVHAVRLAKEAQALAALSHPNVVSVFDVGTSHGHVFVVTELVGGGSLRRWLLEQERLTSSMVLDALTAAGRGLAAAHNAGLVHCDVSPNNIFVGDDGRARIGDFGLARTLREPQRSQTTGGASQQVSSTTLSRSTVSRSTVSRSTVTGAGTPGYIAPEVLQGRRAGPASDQYSFCVTATEALASVPRATVPRAVARVLERGLQQDPADRYASLSKLLSALARARRGRRVARWLFLALPALLVVLGTFALTSPSRDGVCPDHEVFVRRASNQAEVIAARIKDPGVAQRIERRISEHVTQWSSSYASVCERSQQPGVHARTLDLQVICLASQRNSIQAGLSALQAAPDLDLRRLYRALDALPDASECTDADVLRLQAVVPHPREQARVDRLEPRVAAVEGLITTGQHRQARVQLDELATAADAIEFAVLSARVWRARGAVEREEGAFESARQSYARSAHLWTASGHDERAARAWLQVLRIVAVDLAATAATDNTLRTVDALLSRLGDPPALRGHRAHVLGTMHDVAGRADLALPYLLETVQAYRTAHGENSIAYANAVNSLASNRAVAGERSTARELFDEALQLRRVLLGATHPEVGDSLANLGILDAMQRRWEPATAHLRAALKVFEASLPSGSQRTANVEASLAMVLRNIDPEAALPLLKASLQGQTARLEAGHPALIDAQLQYAEGLALVGELAQSDEVLAAALRTTDGPGVPAQLVSVLLVTQGSNALERGDGPAAERSCREAAKVLSDNPVEPWLGNARGCLAEALALAGHFDEALAQWERAQTNAYVELADPSMLGSRELALAKSLAESNPSRSRALVDQARKRSENAPDAGKLRAEIRAWTSGL